ncbi:MAG: UDP-N-acetylmuramoyl-L-alanine--D-glutamate ligase, partial [Clostridia bacterium]|nr:UDP-N-acetylmuramoyl-L-alanine--D-glutamate ligase [Clostridia bacterium]
NYLLAKHHGIKIFSEVEFASLFCKNFVAITGTNGKTTTVELTKELLSTKHKATSCGNNGFPLSRAVLEKKHHTKVVEISSFMLENCKDFAPSVATVLNIEPDHLIRHKTMEEYTKLKMSIFKNLTPKNYAIINLDSNIHPMGNFKVVTYSVKRMADVYVNKGYLYLKNQRIVAVADIKLKGKHNLQNVMCAVAIASLFKVPAKNIKKVLTSFVGENFRIQKIATICGIDFVNDSKSTNIASTLACVDTIKAPTQLLLGGSIKGLDYTKLFKKLPKKVKNVYAYGEIKDELERSNTNFKLFKFETMAEAFAAAVKMAKCGDTVLLSPATASYDQFSNYICRGKAFNQLVRDYEISNKKE